MMNRSLILFALVLLPGVACADPPRDTDGTGAGAPSPDTGGEECAARLAASRAEVDTEADHLDARLASLKDRLQGLHPDEAYDVMMEHEDALPAAPAPRDVQEAQALLEVQGRRTTARLEDLSAHLEDRFPKVADLVLDQDQDFVGPVLPEKPTPSTDSEQAEGVQQGGGKGKNTSGKDDPTLPERDETVQD